MRRNVHLSGSKRRNRKRGNNQQTRITHKQCQISETFQTFRAGQKNASSSAAHLTRRYARAFPTIQSLLGYRDRYRFLRVLLEKQHIQTSMLLDLLRIVQVIRAVITDRRHQ